MDGLARVAARADVPLALASRALRGLPSVPVSTRIRVVEAAVALGFRPDARPLGDTLLVGVPDLGASYFGAVAAGVEAVAALAGMSTTVRVAPRGVAREHFVDDLAAGGVGAAVLVDLPLTPEAAARVDAGPVPTVAVGRASRLRTQVRVDDVLGGRLQAEHLLGQGHVRLAVLGLPPGGEDDFCVATDRITGIRAALGEARVTLSGGALLPCDFSADGGRAAADDALARFPQPTALIALGDEIAIGAMASARDHGLRVPEDLSIIGFDDHPLARHLGLTSIRQDPTGLGVVAAQKALRLAAGEVTSPDSVVALALAERATTAAPRAAARRVA